MHTYTLNNVPDSVLRFWHETRHAQDPIGLLSSSAEWLDLLTSHDASTASVVCQADRVVLPMMRRPYVIDARVMGRSVRRRRFELFKICGGELIASDADASSLADVWDTVFEENPGVDAIWFDHVASAERLALLKQSAALSNRCTCQVMDTELPNFRTLLPPERDACMAMRSSKSLSRLRSKERALARDVGAEVTLHEFCSAEEWAPFAERIDLLMGQSWQVRMLGHEFQLAHHATAASRGMVRAFLLTCGERAIAFTLYYRGHDTLIAGFLAYDQGYARYSPGAVLFLKTLERLYEHDTPRYLDFGEGDAEYKRQWSNDTVEVASLMLCRRSARLERDFAFAASCQHVTSRVRRGLRKIGLERLMLRKAKAV